VCGVAYLEYLSRAAMAVPRILPMASGVSVVPGKSRSSARIRV
jgi:hypothetical protein